MSDWLNLRALDPEMPAELSDIYEPDEYRRSQEYTRTKTYFGFVTAAFDLALLLVFWFAGGFDALDRAAASVWDHPVGTGLLYIGTLGLGHSLVTLPFGIYATFGIEERFGFNKTTARTFVFDRLKALGLLVVLGGPLLAAVLAFFEYAGGLAWVYGWGAVTVFSLVMAFVAPTWIMPLFNKFTPLEPGELRDSILDYARSVDFTISNILVMDGSKRSSKANAFFTGFGRNKRIALFDTLVEKHTTAELTAVVAHEIGHYKRRHVPRGIALGIATTGLLFFILSLVLEAGGLYDAFFMERQSTYAGLVFFRSALHAGAARAVGGDDGAVASPRVRGRPLVRRDYGRAQGSGGRAEAAVCGQPVEPPAPSPAHVPQRVASTAAPARPRHRAPRGGPVVTSEVVARGSGGAPRLTTGR